MELKAYRWLVYMVLVMIYLIVFFQRLSIGAIKGDLEDTFGMSAAEIANLGAMYFYPYALMQIPAGMLIDKFGPRRTVVCGTALAGVATILFSYSVSISMAYGSRLLVGVGVSVVFLSILKILDDWFPAKDFATMSGVTIFMGSMGGLLAQAPLLILIAYIGWRGSFLMMGIITLLLAVLAFLFAKDSPVQLGFPEVNPKPPQPGRAVGESDKILVQLWFILKNPRIWGPSIGLAGIHGCYIVFSGTFGIAYLGYAYGLEEIPASKIVSIAIIAAALSNVALGVISDKLKVRKLPMVILAVLSVLIWVLLLYVSLPIGYLYVFAALNGICISVGVVAFANAKEVNNPHYSGTATSIVNMASFVFAGLMPVICGIIIDAKLAAGDLPEVAYQKGFMVCLVASLLSLGFAFFMKETNCKNIYYDAEER